MSRRLILSGLLLAAFGLSFPASARMSACPMARELPRPCHPRPCHKTPAPVKDCCRLHAQNPQAVLAQAATPHAGRFAAGLPMRVTIDFIPEAPAAAPIFSVPRGSPRLRRPGLIQLRV
jgi:hypothetical protein